MEATKHRCPHCGGPFVEVKTPTAWCPACGWHGDADRVLVRTEFAAWLDFAEDHCDGARDSLAGLLVRLFVAAERDIERALDEERRKARPSGATHYERGRDPCRGG